MEGWIKLYRKMTEWEWYRDTSVKCLFLHLLLTANRSTRSFQGVSVTRGQKLTSRSLLASETGLSESQVKRALSVLRESQEITSHATNRFTLITICNFESYQDTESKKIQPDNQHHDQPHAQPIEREERNTPPTISNDIVSPPRKVFVAPSRNEVREYFEKYNFASDPDEFWVYFQNTDWRLSGGRGAKMKDWRLAAINWNKRETRIRK